MWSDRLGNYTHISLDVELDQNLQQQIRNVANSEDNAMPTFTFNSE